jgi:murein DD-endopeptidase MepM/ murein hydrolase activator NlpD
MKRTLNILLIVGSVATIAITVFVTTAKPAAITAAPADQTEPINLQALPPLVAVTPASFQDGGIERIIQLKTNIPQRPNYKVIEYVVQRGDSPSSIARKFGIQPETILWGNEQLNAAAGSLQAGDTLNILPVDGVLHTVKAGDTLEKIANLYLGATLEEIYEYPGNNFDLTQKPELKPGQQIIVPNGTSPILWAEAQAPIISQSTSSVRGGYTGEVPNLGTGYFIWPVNAYALTQEYWSGHPGLDLATDFRQPIFAADSGTVVFSGWDSTGYGNMVIINHGNGYQTYYSHNEANLVSTGQTVVKGQQIAESGSTGNSTGNHVDFRILLNGVFQNPFDYLP